MQRLHDYAMPLWRLFAGIDAVTSWYNSFSDPGARIFKVAQTFDGGLLVWMTGLIGMIVILDALVNDLTPDYITIGSRTIKVRWKRAFERRHYLFFALAVSYAAQPFASMMAGHGTPSWTFFYSNALQAIVLAFFDTNQRSRSRNWQRACA